MLAEATKERNPVESREANVRQYNVERRGFSRAQGFGPVGARGHTVPMLGKRVAHGDPNDPIIFDKQNSHGVTSSTGQSESGRPVRTACRLTRPQRLDKKCSGGAAPAAFGDSPALLCKDEMDALSLVAWAMRRPGLMRAKVLTKRSFPKSF
jgi:hypothetical protein